MSRLDRNDEWGLEKYGIAKWNQRCDYEDDKEDRMDKLFAEATKDENMQGLFGFIDAYLGEKMNFSYTVDEKRRKIDIESKTDLADKPFICLAWKKFTIENFGGGLSCDAPYYVEELDYSKPVNCVYYWMSIHYSYQHISGGTNGAEIGTAFFKEKDLQWTFIPLKEKVHEHD